MLINTKKVTQLCEKYQIDIYQFWILYLRATNDYENLEKYSQITHPLSLTKIKELEERDLIRELGYTKKGDVDVIDFLDIHVTEKCIETFFKDCNIVTEEIGEELFSVYPKFININGTNSVSTKSGDINGVYYDKEKTIELYLKRIKYSEEKHNKIIEVVTWAKTKGHINVAFRNFVHDELWEALIEMKEQEQPTHTKSKSI